MDQGLPAKERVAGALKHAGVSISVASFTDMCAFLIGATTVGGEHNVNQIDTGSVVISKRLHKIRVIFYNLLY